jgi:hypothetical protein
MIRRAGDRLGERQGRPLSIAEVRRFAPRGREVDPLGALAEMLELADVDVHADAAAVDLAGAQGCHRQRRLGHARLLRQMAELLEGLECLGQHERGVLNPGLHHRVPPGW